MNLDNPKSAVLGYGVGINRVTVQDHVDSILSRLHRFNPMPVSYEPEIGRLTFNILLDRSSFDQCSVEFALVMNFMQGHLPVLTWARVCGTARYAKVCTAPNDSGRRYRWYARGRKLVFMDPEP